MLPQQDHDAARAAVVAAVPAVVSAGLGVPAEAVASWEIHVTPAATAAVARDPAAGVCSVVLMLGAEPRVLATGRPLEPLANGMLTNLGAKGPVGYVALMSDEEDLNRWIVEHCGA